MEIRKWLRPSTCYKDRPLTGTRTRILDALPHYVVVAGAIDYRSLWLSHAPFCCQIKVISVAFMWPGRVPDNNCLPSFAFASTASTGSTSAQPPRSLPVAVLISGGTLNFPTHSHVGLASMCVSKRERVHVGVCLCANSINAVLSWGN